jgi:hypothetical protein
MKNLIIIFVLLACAALNGAGAPETTTTVPILVELFTSEGCSSCPPADAWLKQIDVTQPFAGAQLIVLSEHVDYWNHDGWKDIYSSSFVTDRQEGYVHALGLKGAYTPQIIVDGTLEVRANDGQHVDQTLKQAEATPKIPIRITSVAVDPKNPALLRSHIEADGGSENRHADIYEVVALNQAESQVLHGENSGKHLTHVAVLESLTKIGKLEKGKMFTRDTEIKLKPGTDPKNLRVIVFAQEAGLGKVLGAASQTSIN